MGAFAGGGAAQVGPHTAEEVAQLDHAAASPGCSAPLLGGDAGGAARGKLPALSMTAACQSPLQTFEAVACTTLTTKH